MSYRTKCCEFVAVSLYSFRLVVECSKSTNRSDMEFELHTAS